MSLPGTRLDPSREVELRRIAAATLLFVAAIGIHSAARADFITLKDGTGVKGRIVERGDDAIRIETAEGERVIPLDSIEKIQSTEDLRKIHRERLVQIRMADAEAHFDLAKWLDRVGLADEGRARLGAVLSLDPNHAGARRMLGYVLKKGRWVSVTSTARKSRRKGQGPRLPSDVEAIAALTMSPSAWERQIAYRRLSGIIEGRRKWLLENLSDSAAPSHERARALLEEDAAPEAIAAVAESEGLEDLVESHIEEALLGPLSKRFARQRREVASRLEDIHRKIGSLLPRRRSGKGIVQRERMLDEWESARKSALDAIYDTERYTKDANGVVTGQSLVDERVGALRKVWHPLDRQIESDLSRLLSLSDAESKVAFERLVSRQAMLSETDSFLTSMGATTEGSVDPLPALHRTLLAYRAGRTGLANALKEGFSRWEGILFSRLRDLRALDANEALAKGEPDSGLAPNLLELRQTKILNKYRMMLGRGALEINPNLTECARGHSEEMTRLGYFGHESPVPERKTPSMRAALAGYDGGVSENIHMSGGIASPEGAHEGWYRSPPHHRNMVSDAWFCIGVGQHGSHFTQNFGSKILVAR